MSCIKIDLSRIRKRVTHYYEKDKVDEKVDELKWKNTNEIKLHR